MHRKMSSAEVVCCKELPTISDEISIEANSEDPEQTAPIEWLYTTFYSKTRIKYILAWARRLQITQILSP